MFGNGKGDKEMKYIRTKDKKGKQYIVSDKDYIFLIRDNKVIFARGYEEELLGQADTIEELCDEFVVEDRDEFAIFHNLKLAKQTKGIIYGAVWCEWGLKYVARMNNEGVLELL